MFNWRDRKDRELRKNALHHICELNAAHFEFRPLSRFLLSTDAALLGRQPKHSNNHLEHSEGALTVVEHGYAAAARRADKHCGVRKITGFQFRTGGVLVLLLASRALKRTIQFHKAAGGM